ncbi:acetylornithine deacetylase [Agrococcus baldri]|uniref:Acetylornithine deacetylase n=1 Tax=Agrococcus baldri TaxID=153730 RepID=A0AA94HN35_9MICO|nr:ArgE/DapE family deacylase [Agrococcus baldri]SFS12108.1 acetylornithine deacetylase [Agrococcus baldri]
MRPTPEQRKAVVDAVDAAFDEQLRATEQLVRIPSLRGQEREAQDLLETWMRDLGLTVDRWTLEAASLAEHPGAGAIAVDYDDTEVVVGTLEPAPGAAAEGRSLIINGHVDVVPTGSRELWSRDPFEPHTEDGWMYGRGTGDMKAGVVANVWALHALRAAGLRPAARVHLQSVPEEESTGNGTIACLQRGYQADAVIISEPSGDSVVRAHVGVIWFRVRVYGKAAHASEMSVGTNAIDAAYATIAELRRMEEAWNALVPGSAHFADQEHPLNLNIGTIRAGDWPSSVPDMCELGIRVSFLPEQDVDECWAEIQQRVETAIADLDGVRAETERLGFYADGYVLEEGSEAEAVLAAAHREAAGEELASAAVAGYIDSRCYGLFADTPALVYGPRGIRLHGADEGVELESVRRVTRAMALFIAEWCGVTEA